MKITFHTSCLTLLGLSSMKQWKDALADKAIQAWKDRPQGEVSERFLFQVPSESGKRYHFFKVEPHHLGNMLNVRA